MHFLDLNLCCCSLEIFHSKARYFESRVLSRIYKIFRKYVWQSILCVSRHL